MKYSSPAPDTQQTHETVRINKALAHAGICSRRKADALIEEGAVTVNGKQLTLPGTRIIPHKDRVAVHGRPVFFTRETGNEHVYLLLNKPKETVSTANDPQGRRTVLDLLPQDLRSKRVYPVGRLDYFSQGLLLLTNDGTLTHALTHPSHCVEKEYAVLVRGAVTDKVLSTMEHGMTLAEGERLAPVSVRATAGNGQDIWRLRMIVQQGINRQIRRMCRDCGLTVLRLTRLRQGPLHLGELKSGAVRLLDKEEVAALKKAVSC